MKVNILGGKQEPKPEDGPHPGDVKLLPWWLLRIQESGEAAIGFAHAEQSNEQVCLKVQPQRAGTSAPGVNE